MAAGLDLRQAFRAIVRSPGFAIVVVLTLTLGIGANAAIFSVVDAVILRPLQYPRPEQLIYVTSQFPQQGFDQFWVSPPEFFELQERSRSLATLGAYATGQANLTTPERPRRVNAIRATADLFQALGVAPLLGRTFEAAETRPNGEPVVLLSADLWRSAFGADRSIVGSAIDVGGIRRRVVGVMPPGFDVADARAEIWLPLVLDPANRQNRGNHYLYLIGRLRDGSALPAAAAELETLLAAWPSSVAASPNAGGVHTPNTTFHRLRFEDLQSHVVGGARTAVLVLQGAVVLVLLIACANVANLLLARAESRRKELAVRGALGASRWHLLRPFLIEGMVLSIAGGMMGLAAAVGGLRLLIAAYPQSLPRSGDVHLDAGVLAFTMIVAVACAGMFGLAPLGQLSAGTTAGALKESGQRVTTGALRLRVRRSIVVAETALAVTLVICAGLLLRTAWNLVRVDAGFARGELITFGVSLPQATYSRPDAIAGFYDRLTISLRSLPGVRRVAAMSGLPPLRQVNANDTGIEGYHAPPTGPFENIDYYQTVMTGYVETMGIPVVEGRAFQPSDAAETTAMVNETMARTYYRDGSAIGRRVRPCCGDTVPWLTIVGVLKDVKQGGVDQRTGTEVYFNFEQLPRSIPTMTPGTMNIVLRSAVPISALAGSIGRAVAAIDPSLPIIRLRTMDDVFAEASGRPRLMAQLLGIFAGLALLLAAIGTYGVLSYMVTERRREIGIRMALGAGRGTVLAMVLKQGLSLTLAGLIVGFAGALAGGRVLRTLLFGVAPSDPVTLAGVFLLIVIASAIGCYLPARLATRVDPLIVLRDE